jgi:hypothetical protein
MNREFADSLDLVRTRLAQRAQTKMANRGTMLDVAESAVSLLRELCYPPFFECHFGTIIPNFEHKDDIVQPSY